MSGELENPVKIWVVTGERIEADGSTSRLTAMSSGRTEASARKNWVSTWGKGVGWLLDDLTFSQQGGDK